MSYLSARTSRAVLDRLRREQAPLLVAGGLLPEGDCWLEGLAPERGEERKPGEWRWQVLCESGWANIGSTWPASLIAHAPRLYFVSEPSGMCSVSPRAPQRSHA